MTQAAGPEPEPVPRRLTVLRSGAAMFTAWRQLLDSSAGALARVGRRASRTWHAWSAQWVLLGEYHAISALPWREEAGRARETASAVGLRAFAFGMLVAGLATSAARNAWVPGVAVVILEVLWAAARYVIIALTVPKGSVDRWRLGTACFAGLVPYVFGATPALRLIALAASGHLTHRGLIGAGVPRADASRAIAWSFGGQVGVTAAGWVLRAGVALLVGA
ncbi:MAG: hypothetical protein ACYCXZ_04770 [Coriobacteriia bacterium]